MRRGPAWLGDFQARFGDMLRTPLDRSTGTLTAQTARYGERLCEETTAGSLGSSRERLAVYNRQYWFRLLTVMQTAYPLTTALMGAWALNGAAARFFLERPPRGFDIDHAPDGFAAFVLRWVDEGNEVGRPERQAVCEAALLDEAWRQVFRAKVAAPYRPSPADASRLLSSRLVPSPAVALVGESYPLFELKRALLAGGGEAVTLGARLEARRWSALVHTGEGLAQVPLEPREGELMALLRELAVGEALAALEARCSDDERAGLPARAQRWLSRGVELGAWAGLEGGQGA